MPALSPAWVWGVDVAVARLDIAFVNQDGSWQTNAVQVDEKLKGAARLSRLYDSTRQFARACGGHFPPLIVYLERPTGQFPNPPLDHACGIARAALYEGLSGIYPFPVDIELVAVKDWRKKILGSGNANKDAALAWAAGVGYDGDRADPAEALAIAACAAHETGFGPGPLHPIVH